MKSREASHSAGRQGLRGWAGEVGVTLHTNFRVLRSRWCHSESQAHRPSLPLPGGHSDSIRFRFHAVFMQFHAVSYSFMQFRSEPENPKKVHFHHQNWRPFQKSIQKPSRAKFGRLEMSPMMLSPSSTAIPTPSNLF